MQLIHTIAELDAKIDACNQAERISDSAMRQVFTTFAMAPPADLPADPFAPAYQARQMALYAELSGKTYSNTHERTHFDIEAALARPFPFSTGSAATAGDYFAAIGFLLRCMDLPPGARVVEFGPGWGFTSLWLAKLGHKVTVVEIDPAFCALLARRAAQEGVEIEIVNDDFMWIARAGRQFDAAVFFECFHHCADHLGLLAALADAVAPEGALYFAAEPITADFPMPWGLRLDGNSLWAIRKNGWLELGFREDYFAAALRRTGWVGQRLSCGDHGMMVVWQARRRAALRIHLAGDDPALRSEIGTRAGAALLLEGQRAGTGLFGPYVDLPAGGYLARIHFAAPVAGKAVMDVCAEGGARVLARQQVEARTLRDDNTAELAFHAADDLRGMEVRLFCDRGFRARIGSVEIIPHDAA